MCSRPCSAPGQVGLDFLLREIRGGLLGQVGLDFLLREIRGGLLGQVGLDFLLREIRGGLLGQVGLDLLLREIRGGRQLHAFRAGIEGIISFLKRGFGLGRCAWRGFQSFCAYVQASVVACNLLSMARQTLAAAKAT